jgi:hypothetical protein
MLELTKAGASERQIAESLGVSRGLVHREVKRVLSDLAKAHDRSANVVRSLQMERYLTMLSRWWQQALAGDETASNMVLRIMARIDIINGIIPDKPLIDMRTQTLQIGEGIGLMELARVVANGSRDHWPHIPPGRRRYFQRDQGGISVCSGSAGGQVV